jgi:hypothetical protein
MTKRHAGALAMVLAATVSASAARASAQEVTPPADTTHAPAASPTDAAADRRLGDDRFSAGDLRGALDAWNHAGTPHLTDVTVEGLTRTKPDVVKQLLGLRPGRLLGADAFTRADHRLDELPATAQSSLAFDRDGADAVRVGVSVTERPRTPRGPLGWAAVAVHAAFVKEVHVDIASAARLGEVLGPSYRWATRRPRVRLRGAVPIVGLIDGTVGVDLFWEQQSYRHPALDGLVSKQERRRLAANVSSWATGWLRWQAGAASDRIDDRAFVAVAGALNTRGLGDRVAVSLNVERWAPVGRGDDAFDTRAATIWWRSTTRSDVAHWSALAGVASASTMAPLAVWPGADSGAGRGIFLRAHPLVHHDILSGDVFGRRVGFGSVEYAHPVYRSRYGNVAVAGFADSAQAWRRIDDAPASRLQVDLGAGVRVNSAKADGQVRVDLAVGARDGRLRASAGYVTRWGEGGW